MVSVHHNVSAAGTEMALGRAFLMRSGFVVAVGEGADKICLGAHLPEV
jgi:hypothetical protein